MRTMIGTKKFAVALMLLALILLACASTVPQQATITLNPAVTYQTMLGWEATAQAGQLELRSLFLKYKDALFDSTVNDLGINRIRLEIQNGAENPVDYFSQYYRGQITRSEWKKHWYEIINDNDDPNTLNPAGFQFATLDYTIDTVVTPIKQRVEARGEKLYINLNYVDFGPSAFEHKNYPEEYAEFMLATFLHLRDKYGWTPDAIEMVLEADNAGWNGTQLGQAIVATGDRLKAHGFHPAFIAPSTASMAVAIPFFDQIVQVPLATQYITELSYHRYGGVSDANLQAIGNRAIQYGIQTAHLELIGANYLDLHKDLTLGSNSSWAEYTLAWTTSTSADDGGKYYMIDDHDPNQPVVQYGARAKYLRQYFKYVRRGAVRIQAVSDNPAFDPVAFVNADCKQTVVVKADGGGDFSIKGLAAGVYGVKYTTSDQYDVDNPDVTISAGQSLQTSIPAQGVITIYARSAACSPLVNLSAASYRYEELATESVVAVFGKDLASSTITASSAPLPTSLGGTTVKVTDARGVSRPAPLYFVSPYQINYQIPPGTSNGPAVVAVTRGEEIVAFSSVFVTRVAPGLFTADSSGRGLPAAVLLRVAADGSQRYEPIFQFDVAQNQFVAVPIDLGAESDQVFLALYGTGIRFRSAPSAVKAMVANVEAPVEHAEAVISFTGLDQVAIRLPRSLAGRGAADVALTVDGKPCNIVTVNIK